MTVPSTADRQFRLPDPGSLPPAIILDPAYKANPHPHYRDWVRQAPFWARLDGEPVVIAARYADVDAVYSDPARFSSEWPKHSASPRFDYFNGLQDLVHTDPPEHTRLRAIIAPAFAPVAVAKLEARIQTLADQLVADAAAKKGPFDVMEAIARPLSANILLGILLGIAPKDFPIFINLSNAMALLAPGAVGGEKPPAYREAWAAARAYCDAVIEDCKKTPRDDVIGQVVAAHEGGRMSADEMLVMLMGLFLGGISTVATFVGNAFVQLASRPEQYKLLVDNPDLVPNAVEEVLRYDSPGLFNYKFATRDLSLGGLDVPAGTTVYILQAAAGFDPAVFEDPERFAVMRKMGRHLTFGRGVHFCIGAPIARLALKAALRAASRAFPALRLENGESIRYGGWAPERAPERVGVTP